VGTDGTGERIVIWSELGEDARELTRVATGHVDGRSLLRTILTNDSFWILATWRLRALARRWHVPLVNHLLRRVQTVVFGIEIGNDVGLGRGVYFVHPIGIVIGGNARVGDRVKLMGSNTVGTAKDNGYPEVEHDVVLGVGSRVLGPIRVGQSSAVGANAVVLHDLPPGSVAVGIPARVVRRPGVGRETAALKGVAVLRGVEGQEVCK
jgi:serine O-acetyltransferase